MIHAQHNSSSLDMFKLFIEIGVDVNSVDSDNRNVLMMHLKQKEPNPKIISFLIEKGINVNNISKPTKDFYDCN
jgi:ankyrin repeat protein